MNPLKLTIHALDLIPHYGQACVVCSGLEPFAIGSKTKRQLEDFFLRQVDFTWSITSGVGKPYFLHSELAEKILFSIFVLSAYFYFHQHIRTCSPERTPVMQCGNMTAGVKWSTTQVSLLSSYIVQAFHIAPSCPSCN